MASEVSYTGSPDSSADASPCRNLVDCAERLAALLLLACSAPLLLAVGLSIAFLSGRSPLVAHLRVGRGGAPLWMLKFRTMWDRGAGGRGRFRAVEFIADDFGPASKSSGDPKVGCKFARVCRRYSLDELPQLVHVVTGRMSLVGPRPLTRSELAEHYGPDAEEVLRAKPGLTGLWQVSGRSLLTYEERRALDLYFVRNQSLSLRLSILARTLPQVLGGKNAW